MRKLWRSISLAKPLSRMLSGMAKVTAPRIIINPSKTRPNFVAGVMSL
jgi:hypothetical protein